MLSEAGVCADGRLGEEFVSSLEPRLQDALSHPVRREILRVLHAKEQPCGLGEFLGGLRSLARPEIVYHLEVLQAAGAVVVDGSRPCLRGRDDLYRSALTDHPGALAVLGVTELSDRKHREQVRKGKSSSHLTMFRVPRPAHTIRLRMRSGRKAKPAE